MADFFWGNYKLTKETVDKLKNGEQLEHKDLEWEFCKEIEKGDILKIIKWPYALFVTDIVPGVEDGDCGEINMSVTHLLHLSCAGSSFDDFLKKEGLLDECQEEAKRRVADYQTKKKE